MLSSPPLFFPRPSVGRSPVKAQEAALPAVPSLSLRLHLMTHGTRSAQSSAAFPCFILMQRLCGTDLRTLAAEDALRSVFPFAGLLVDLYVHGADAQTFPAVDAFAFIAVHAQ